MAPVAPSWKAERPARETPHERGSRVDPTQTAFLGALDRLPPGADPDLASQLLAALWESDRTADEVVADFCELPGGEGWRLLEEVLAKGLDGLPEAPPSLSKLLTPVLVPPAWLNCELLDAGCVAYCRAGPANAFAGARTLSFGYAIPRTAKILLSTGRLETMAGKRLLETSQWVLAATTPGNMRPDHDGDGIAACIRVRLIHAYVRRQLLAQQDWDVELDAIPLNATDIAATLNVGFFALHVQGVERLGIRYSPGEKQAIAHMWRWVAYVIGVAPAFQPLSYEHARAFQDVYVAFGERTASDAAKILTSALLRHGVPRVALGIPPSRANDLARLTVPFTGALLSYVLGAEDARIAGLPRNPLTFPMRAAPLAGRAYNVLRACGLLGDDATIAAASVALNRRLLTSAASAEAPAPPAGPAAGSA